MVVLLIIAILLAIAIPTFLGVTNTAGDRAAQSNLTNALTEAKALYQVSQGYSTNGVAYTSGQFTSLAPEFTWNQGTACSTSSNNCVSYAVFNVTFTGDGQGLSLAVDSAKTNTCWYAFDLESTPVSGTAPLSTKALFPTAGVFYGKATPFPLAVPGAQPGLRRDHYRASVHNRRTELHQRQSCQLSDSGPNGHLSRLYKSGSYCRVMPAALSGNAAAGS